MAPLAQQEPTENSNVAAIEQAVADMRLMQGVEAKIASGEPLSRPEINHLYQFDEPIYARTRDDWPWGLYSDEAPDLAARIDRYQDAKRVTRESTTQTLREEYGHDADWLLADYRDISARIERLLEAGATPALLAEHLSPTDRLRHFELLRSSGVALDPREVYEAYSASRESRQLPNDVIEAFITRYPTELIGLRDIPWRLVRASLHDVEESQLEATIENLMKLGIEHAEIIRALQPEVIEARFQWFQDAGFSTRGLLQRSSLTYALDNFDTLFSNDPEAMRSLYMKNPSSEDRARYIIGLHRNGQPVKQLLATMNKGPHHSLTPQYEAFIEAGISIDDIVDTFSGDDQSLIHMYAPWLMKNGANPEAIKAKFSPQGIIAVFEALRKAGIEVDLQEYVDQLPSSIVMSRRFVLDREEDVTIDYDAQFDAYEFELTMASAFQFLDAGVDPKKVFTKLPPGAIANDNMISIFVEAGISRETVWKKVDKPMQEAAHWQALTDADSTDESFEAALRVLPVSTLNKAFDTIVKRPAYINLVVDRFAEKNSVDSRIRLFIEHGADVNHVVRSVSKGFWRLYDEAEWLLEQGADALALFDQIGQKFMNVGMLHAFIEKGVPVKTAFESVGDDYVANQFDELIKKGYDKAMLLPYAMKKPTSWFVINNLTLLNEAGYSADQLSSHLSPKEVVENIKDLLLIGLSPALAVTHVMQQYQCSQTSAEEVISQRLGIAY